MQSKEEKISSSIDQIEDQTDRIEDQATQKKTSSFTFRNFVMSGVVLLLLTGGLGYFYRKELFGVGVEKTPSVAPSSNLSVPQNTNTDNTESDNEDEIPSQPQSQSQSKKYPLKLNCPDTVDKALINNFLAEHGAVGGSVDKMSFDTIEDLFSAFVDAPEGCVMESGINEDFFEKASDNGFLLLPVKPMARGKTKNHRYQSFNEILEAVKEFMSKDDLEYEINFTKMEKYQELFDSCTKKPFVLRFALPKNNKSFHNDRFDSIVEKVDSDRIYFAIGVDDEVEYSDARLAVLIDRYDEKSKDSLIIHSDERRFKTNGTKIVIPMICGKEPLKREVEFDSITEFISSLNDFEEKYPDCDLDYGNLFRIYPPIP